jgi:hypothetical protein
LENIYVARESAAKLPASEVDPCVGRQCNFW